MEPSSVPVLKRRSRPPVPKRDVEDNFDHSKFTAKRGKSRTKPSASGTKGRPSNETQNVRSNIVGRVERHRNAGGHMRRCICRWIMTYGRWLDPYEFVMSYNDGQGCPICRVKFRSEDSQSDHFDMHGKEFAIFARDGDRRVTRYAFRLEIKYLPRYSRMSIRIENDSNAVLVLRSVYLLQLDKRLDATLGGPLRMAPGYTYEIDHTIEHCIPNHVYTVILVATVACSRVELIEQYHVQMLKSTKIVGKPLKMDILPYHHIPDYLIAIYKNNFEHSNNFNRLAMLCLENLRQFIKQGLTPTNYIEQLRLLNMIEDYDLQTIFSTYTIHNALVSPAEQNRRYIISVDQFQVAPAMLEIDGYVRITVQRSSGPRGAILEYVNGYIDAISEDDIVVTMQQPVRFHLPCKVEFPLNRTQYKLEYNALNLISRIDLEKFLFTKSLPKKKKPVRQTEFRWFQPTIANNREQMTAIRNIINMTSFPAPYVLFGPPGTGKTSTIVEAVLQIWKNQPKASVLVAASSNLACDEVTKRLRQFIPEEEIFRFFSRSCERNIDNIDIGILEISNLATGIYEVPSYEHVYRCRITVSTVTNCGRFAQAHINSTFFDYVFIDECGSAKEVSALVPIAGVCTEGPKIQASVILAGDPKQLGPVVRTEYLKQTVHNTSLLDRLMSQGIYKRHKGQYNPLVITKLLDNYRSHGALIHYSNEWFYDGELRACAAPDLADWAVGWSYLPNPVFPIIMHSVVGVTRMDRQCLSSYNKEEARCVLHYIQKILSDGINDRQIREEDIGVITPYSKQVSYLRHGCRNYGWENVEVGSTEQYQGREKPIMILSTVRSQRDHVGFLSNSKRLNVAITRARALMIIVGNPDTLQRDPHWYRLLRYISDNQGVRGVEFQPKQPDIDLSGQPFSYAMEEEDFA
ncbi:putative helicase MOV-10 isoform X2 [Armigeres subalbatus]|uniref:putative helicase MOV-10 isoform X2 n=1 Tax=Armigeres subalbatus TaxID=124917 RepID=UPI002ED1AFFD